MPLVGCLMVLFALVAPRSIMFLLWVFTDYLSQAFGSFLWPLLGFFFLPTTTMAFAVAENELQGMKGWGLVVLILGVMVDFGLLGGGGRAIGRRADH
ncbi:MAG: hypothetical protein ACXWEJ_00225 [Actinomycetota bacterium]